MIGFGNYTRFNKKIRYINDSPRYVYGKYKDCEPIRPICIKRFSQNLGFYPNLIIENKYLIRSFKKSENIFKKV